MTVRTAAGVGWSCQGWAKMITFLNIITSVKTVDNGLPVWLGWITASRPVSMTPDHSSDRSAAWR